MNNIKKISPWAWVPTLYFAQGIPYFIVNNISVLMFAKMGVPNGDMALFTSLLYLPWTIKPFWSPFVDIIRTKRWWVVSMQILMSIAFILLALTIPHPDEATMAAGTTPISMFTVTLILFIITAFASATHDIAADGFYMLGLDTKKQAFFVGIRNTAYRLAMLTGQGLIVMFAGWLEKTYSSTLPEEIAVPRAWSVTFYLLAILFVLLFLYHQFILPKPGNDVPVKNGNPLNAFFQTFITFFQKKGIIAALAFILLFRFAESQLVKIASPFLLDNPEVGGLGLNTMQVGTIYGVVGLIALTIGGILGGIFMAKNGLKHWIWWMTAAMNLPNIVYVYLAFVHPSNIWLISSAVAIEQFGYGFGFTALTYFMMLFSKGPQQTAHYAICTGFMALGMMLPGMISGYIQELIGYQHFFLWIMLCTIPSFIAVKYIKI